MKKLLFVVILFSTLTSWGQYGVFGGYSFLYGFSSGRVFNGFHIGAELPKSDVVSLVGKFTFLPGLRSPQKRATTLFAKSPMTSPQVLDINYTDKMNYFILEGGTRFYAIGTYDTGFSLYGGTKFALVFNQVKLVYENYDKNQYYVYDQETRPEKGSIINIGLGLEGGFKNTFPGKGTLYSDFYFQYFLFSQGSNATATQESTMYSPLLIGFTVGFRKDFY